MIYGFQMGTFAHGSGRITLNTLKLNEAGTPAADKLLVNLAGC